MKTIKMLLSFGETKVVLSVIGAVVLAVILFGPVITAALLVIGFVCIALVSAAIS